jgi:cation transport ATPase
MYMTHSILDNPVTVNGIATPFTNTPMQTIADDFSHIFSMFWKYIIAIIAIIWCLYRYTFTNALKSAKRITGG